jgi:hypothetical protein
MAPLEPSNNLAARMGRWSASHWKTAVFGWLAFVVAALVVGSAIGTKRVAQDDANVGEARRADHILKDAGFRPHPQLEIVTIVRAVLLPAAMILLGDRNWYLPRWLEWLPRLEHAESRTPPVVTTPSTQALPEGQTP